MKRLPTVILITACLLPAGLALKTSALEKQSAILAKADPVRGATLYRTKCIACHSLDRNRVGPKHRGVFGRRAGAVADYGYSTALKESTLVWDAAQLNSWLRNPATLIPGQRMGFRVNQMEDRRDIIAYLKSLSAEQRN